MDEKQCDIYHRQPFLGGNKKNTIKYATQRHDLGTGIAPE
jgi:hypothetical protein